MKAVKIILKTTGIILLVIIAILIIGVIALLIKAKKDAAIPIIAENYQETTATGGDIEARYLGNGSCEVSCLEGQADESLIKYLVYYPAELESSTRRYPVIIYSNGSGVTGSKCLPLFKHWASWGFIVAANEESSSWSGMCAEQTLSWLLEQNDSQNTVLYGKIDTDNIGITGHSQGGVSVFNALTEYEHSAMFKTGVSVSPTQEELASNLQWNYDLTRIKVPILMLAGAKGEGEMELVLPQEAMEQMYGKLDVPKAMARKTDCEHNDTDSAADGYVTAWFLWQLQGNEDAARAFTGDRPELMTNPLYQNQKIDLD